MHVKGKMKTLFDAFSRIGAKAFQNPRLLSCHTLAKNPYYDHVLRRYLIQAPIRPVSFLHGLDLGLKYYAGNGVHLLLILLAKIALWSSGWKAPSLAGGKKPVLLIDTFLAIPKVIERKRFTELYLPGLAEEAEQQGWAPIYFFRLYGTRDPRLFLSAFRILREASVAGLTDLHLFTFRDWLSLLWHYLVYPFAHWKLIRSISRTPHDAPEAYIRDALIHTLPGGHMMGECRRLAGKRLGETLDAKARVVSWHENQISNKAFYYGLWEAENNTGRHVPVIGAQLTLWPDSLLGHHPDDAEVALHLTPDTVLVNGPYYLPDASIQTYKPGPSLRYKQLFDSLNKGIGSLEQHRGKPVLALLSYREDEVKRVLTLIREAKLPENPAFKFHPSTDIRPYRHLLPSAPVIVTGSLYSAFEEASLVIGAGSGDLAEAVALGIPAIAVEDILGIPGLDFNYLPQAGRGKLWQGVRRAEDLPGAIEALRTALHDPDRQETVKNFRNLLFTEPTEEKINAAFALK